MTIQGSKCQPVHVDIMSRDVLDDEIHLRSDRGQNIRILHFAETQKQFNDFMLLDVSSEKQRDKKEKSGF